MKAPKNKSNNADEFMVLNISALKTTNPAALSAICKFLTSKQTHQDYIAFRNAIWKLGNEEYKRAQGIRSEHPKFERAA